MMCAMSKDYYILHPRNINSYYTLFIIIFIPQPQQYGRISSFRASSGHIGFAAAGIDALVAQGFTSMTCLLMFQKNQI
jgi:hypothetical protein